MPIIIPLHHGCIHTFDVVLGYTYIFVEIDLFSGLVTELEKDIETILYDQSLLCELLFDSNSNSFYFESHDLLFPEEYVGPIADKEYYQLRYVNENITARDTVIPICDANEEAIASCSSIVIPLAFPVNSMGTGIVFKQENVIFFHELTLSSGSFDLNKTIEHLVGIQNGDRIAPLIKTYLQEYFEEVEMQ